MMCNTKSAFKQLWMFNIVLNSTTDESSSKNCVYTIRAYSTKVCQLRIDFHYLHLEQPSTVRRGYTYCAGDRLIINGMPFDFCGTLSRQHIYVPFDAQRLTDVVDLRFEIGSNMTSLWNMEVNQIECNHKAPFLPPDERQAPDGCLQYFYQSSGLVESFNFGHAYYGNTHYAICFNRNYRKNTVLQLTDILFEMAGISKGNSPQGVDDECLDPNGAINIKDYISIPFAELIVRSGNTRTSTYHSLFCMNSLDGNELEFIHVNTDDITNDVVPTEKGFSFLYRITSW